MKKYSGESGIPHPEHLRGNQLRQHIATQSAMMDLREHEVDDLANFMGHAEKIHREHYQIPVVTRDIGRISQLLGMGVGDFNQDCLKNRDLTIVQFVDDGIYHICFKKSVKDTRDGIIAKWGPRTFYKTCVIKSSNNQNELKQIKAILENSSTLKVSLQKDKSMLQKRKNDTENSSKDHFSNESDEQNEDIVSAKISGRTEPREMSNVVSGCSSTNVRGTEDGIDTLLRSEKNSEHTDAEISDASETYHELCFLPKDSWSKNTDKFTTYGKERCKTDQPEVLNDTTSQHPVTQEVASHKQNKATEEAIIAANSDMIKKKTGAPVSNEKNRLRSANK
ncbi:hypothetical protein JTB14_011642 [Gonioctena quinquepunctata]|nr:hypothetical protein JTB14_011642 [Gonioctena quinquepunctata]